MRAESLGCVPTFGALAGSGARRSNSLRSGCGNISSWSWCSGCLLGGMSRYSIAGSDPAAFGSRVRPVGARDRFVLLLRVPCQGLAAAVCAPWRARVGCGVRDYDAVVSHHVYRGHKKRDSEVSSPQLGRNATIRRHGLLGGQRFFMARNEDMTSDLRRQRHISCLTSSVVYQELSACSVWLSQMTVWLCCVRDFAVTAETVRVSDGRL